MIKVTRLNGKTLYVNAEMIRFVEATPDTVISLTDGGRVVVVESPEQVMEAMIGYQRSIRAPMKPRSRSQTHADVPTSSGDPPE